MALVQYDFWSHILWSATESPCLPTNANALGEAKIHLCGKYIMTFMYLLQILLESWPQELSDLPVWCSLDYWEVSFQAWDLCKWCLCYASIRTPQWHMLCRIVLRCHRSYPWKPAFLTVWAFWAPPPWHLTRNGCWPITDHSPISEYWPQFSTQAHFHQHVHILSVSKCFVQPANGIACKHIMSTAPSSAGLSFMVY